MLRKRVEVLFGDKDYERLEELAHTQHRSVGSLVREAVAKYVAGPSDAERERLLSMSGGPVGTPEEIRKTILDAQYEGITKSLETDLSEGTRAPAEGSGVDGGAVRPRRDTGGDQEGHR